MRVGLILDLHTVYQLWQTAVVVESSSVAAVKIYVAGNPNAVGRMLRTGAACRRKSFRPHE
jgi:hypothetical protein